MPIENQDCLRIHVVNVDHGDAIILEFPDYDGLAHFGVVDTGRPGSAYASRPADYLEALTLARDKPYRIEFVCITHPHEDHYGGLRKLIERFAPPGNPTTIQQFWDCGFRTAAKTYNRILEDIANDDRIVFVRQSAGAEYEYGPVRVVVLAPSLDLRNRFDTFGVDRNNASIVLKVEYRRSIAILAGDAHFDSWGKITEEFPRTTKITYFKDAQVERSEGSNQLNCQLLKVSHHGSKHGTSLEYVEKLAPTHFAVTCANADWYQANKPNWGMDWPHPLTMEAINEVHKQPDVRRSHEAGHIVYHLAGAGIKSVKDFRSLPGQPEFPAQLIEAITLP